MKPTEEELQVLLEDVLPPPGNALGPNLSDVLALARRDRRRRRHIRAVSGGILALLLTAVAVFLHEAEPEEALAPADPATPERIVVRRIDDDQLMALLQGTPAALMEWPNGARTLLIVENQTSRW